MPSPITAASAQLADGLVALVECRLETGDAPIKSACIWHISATRFWATRFMAVAWKSRAGLLTPAQQAALDRLNRQALHAAALGFEHPETGEAHFYETPLPDDMQSLLALLAES